MRLFHYLFIFKIGIPTNVSSISLLTILCNLQVDQCIVCLTLFLDSWSSNRFCSCFCSLNWGGIGGLFDRPWSCSSHWIDTPASSTLLDPLQSLGLVPRVDALLHLLLFNNGCMISVTEFLRLTWLYHTWKPCSGWVIRIGLPWLFLIKGSGSIVPSCVFANSLILHFNIISYKLIFHSG